MNNMDSMRDKNESAYTKICGQNIRRLREKIEENPSDPKYVHTKWGVGYYFSGTK